MVEQQCETPRTILCVDDLQDSLIIRKLMLELFGYRVLTTTSPVQALEVLESEKVDLVVLDYRYPRIPEDGEWLARQIRNRWSTVRTIMLSGYPEIPKSAMDSVDCFCLKGGEPGELKRTIGKLLRVDEKGPTLEETQKRSAELRETAQKLRNESRRNRRSG
jgi:CheY-like chemotaxis protein